jgi:hypothetical protein
MAIGTWTKRAGVAALAMAAVMMIASPAVAASSLSVQNVSTCGSTAVVTVRNSSPLLSYGTVRVDANVNGVSMTGSTSVVLLPGQTANVSIKFGGVIGSLLAVGVVDAPSPF